MRKLTDHDLTNIAGMTVSGYHVEGVRIKRGVFSDSDHYGFILGKNVQGHYVTWEFHLDEDDKPNAYWGHYFMEDREAAIKDFNNRTLDAAPKLSSDYWDCQCDEKYIHSNSVGCCHVCGALRDEMPDSRLDEVNEGTHFAEDTKPIKRFNVTITEMLQKVVIVEAGNSDEAKQIVSDEWRACIHILGPEDFVETEFVAVPACEQNIGS